ncbi:MAG: phosphotransferase [Clostridiales bacterium]|nr:phosphotransferase [Clostridiales bacterium]
MNDKYCELLEQYEVTVISTFRSRGTFQCETDQGLGLLKEYHCSMRKLAMEYEWKEKLANAGFDQTDQYFISKNQSLVVYDRYHTPFVLKHYFHGRECSLASSQDIYNACRNLAFLHKTSKSITDIPFEDPHTESIEHLFIRRNRELRTIRKYISKTNQKKPFELLYTKYFSHYYEEAVHALEELKKMEISGVKLACGVCHGAYHHHNILILPDDSVATVGFESICYQPYLMDLYLFLRKTLEKNHYSCQLFEIGISGYSEYLPLDRHDFQFLYLLFLYPEKFWKVSNQYYNRRKTWIPPKMEEKLRKIPEQNEERTYFLNSFSHHLLK